MGLFKTLETIGRVVTGQTHEAQDRRRAQFEWRKEHGKDYCCKYCGYTSYSIQNLTSGYCDKSPNNHHVPY